MDKKEAYAFLDSLLENVEPGEWVRVEMAIKKVGDSWQVQIFDLDEMEKNNESS